MRSIFGQILADVIDGLPEARGAIFADWEGEAVDQAARVSDSEIQLVGAHWGVVFHLAQRSLSKLGLSDLEQLVLRFSSGRVVVIRKVTSEYYVLIEVDGATSLGRALSALDRAQQQLREQM